jgi:hypothetical protein
MLDGAVEVCTRDFIAAGEQASRLRSPTWDTPIMRIVKILSLLTLCLASTLATAQEKNKNCRELTNPQARQECLKRTSSADVDCSGISDSRARKECAQRKQENSPDCSKLATAELRQQCFNQKAK